MTMRSMLCNDGHQYLPSTLKFVKWWCLHGDTTNTKSNRMKVKTFNAIQNIKYVLQPLHPAVCISGEIKVFHRDNKHYSPNDSSLVTNT